MTSNAECEFVFHLGGVIYHGAFAIGGPLHEGAWTDLGGGIIESATSHPGFFVCTGGAHASALDAKSGATHNSYIVSGSATRAVNGRFNRSGHFNGVPCFKNENDLLLFQATLKETPELAITAQELGMQSSPSAPNKDKASPSNVDSELIDGNFQTLSKLGQRLAGLERLEHNCAREEQKTRPEEEEVYVRSKRRMHFISSQYRHLSYRRLGSVQPFCQDLGRYFFVSPLCSLDTQYK